MKKITKIAKGLLKITNFFAAVAMTCTFVLVLINVVMRYLFHSGLAWSEEGARYALIVLIILGIVDTTYHRDHFAVDILENKVSGNLKKVIKAVQDIIVLILDLIMAVGSYNMAKLNWLNQTPSIGLPAWLPYGFMLFTTIVSAIFLILHILEDVGIFKSDLEED